MNAFSTFSKTSRFMFGLLASVGFAIAAPENTRAPLHVSTMRNVRIDFFSSSAPERLARFQFGALGGAQRQIGPFRIATPGAALKDVRLELNSTPCTADDWDTLLAGLTRYRQVQLPQPMAVLLPDGREYSISRFPKIKDRKLVLEQPQLQPPALGSPDTPAVFVTWSSATGSLSASPLPPPNPTLTANATKPDPVPAPATP